MDDVAQPPCPPLVPLTRQDWIAAGYAALQTRGLPGIAVERLARELGTSKGSFYWHFAGRPELVEAVLGEWERSATDALLERVATIEDPAERLESLFRQALDPGATGRAESHLLVALDDPVVATALRRVTAKRLEALVGLFEAAGLDPATARAHATIGLATQIGLDSLAAIEPAGGQLAPPEHVIAALRPLMRG